MAAGRSSFGGGELGGDVEKQIERKRSRTGRASLCAGRLSMSTQHTLNSNRPRFTAIAAIPCAEALGSVVRKNLF